MYKKLFRQGVVVMAMLVITATGLAAPAKEAKPQEEPPRHVPIVDWCLPVVNFAVVALVARRDGMPYDIALFVIERGLTAGPIDFSGVTKDRIRLIADKAFAIPLEDIQIEDNGGSPEAIMDYVQWVTNECHGWLKEANEKAEKGQAI